MPGRTMRRILVWTTTPWTLVSNTALAVHPQLAYVELRKKGSNDPRTIIMAESKFTIPFDANHILVRHYEHLGPDIGFDETIHPVILFDRRPHAIDRRGVGRSPDVFFRGFYCWNSEVGARTLGIASFYLRAVCQNRNLWGVEDFEEITIRHSKYAASRFAAEAEPALIQFAESSPMPFINGIKAARERIVARDDEDRESFLRKRAFSKVESTKIIDAVLAEEGRPPESIFDFVQGITRVARDKLHQDVRLEMEGKAKKLLEFAV